MSVTARAFAPVTARKMRTRATGWVSAKRWGHAMKPRADTLQQLQRCLDVIASSEPMTDAERADHRCRCAEEQARAEARRAADVAPDLLGGV